LLPDTIATTKDFYLERCPVALLYRTPIIADVLDAHRWCKQLGQPLSDLYPLGTPEFIQRAVLAIDAGLQKAESDRIKKITKKSKSSD
jgi:hypothetical protein